MKNDMLEALLMISLNGPDANSDLAEKLIRKVTLRFDSSRRNKRPTLTKVFLARKSTSVSVQTDDAFMDTAEDARLSEELDSIERQLDSTVKNAEPWVACLLTPSSDDESGEEDESDMEDDSD